GALDAWVLRISLSENRPPFFRDMRGAAWRGVSSFRRLDGRRRQVLCLLQARPLLGGTPLTDGLELPQENPPQECDPGIGGRQVLLRAIADDSLSPDRD